MTYEEKEFILCKVLPELDNRINWLFERQNMDGVFPVFFVLYSYKHGLRISFNETSMLGYNPGADALQDRLYDASLMVLGGDKTKFAELRDIQALIESFEKRLFDASYDYFLDWIIIKHTNLGSGTHLRPNPRIATTISNILKEHGCKTVYCAYSGIGVYALACNGLVYTGTEPYAPANLVAEVLCDAFEVKKTEFYDDNPLEYWTKRKFDAVIGNLPVDADFWNVYRADRFLKKFNDLQNDFIKKLIAKKTARKTAALLVHFEFANYGYYDETRELICRNGMLETVIALPEDIFREADVPTYLLILDMEGGRHEAEFIDAQKSLRKQRVLYDTYSANTFDIRDCANEDEHVVISYETIARAAWSFNPAVYIQNATCKEGQELVRLGDLVSFSYGNMVTGRRVIHSSALSEMFSRVASDIKPEAADGMDNQPVDGPCVMLALTPGRRDKTQKLVYGICREYGSYSVDFFLTVLKPDPEKILPEYLALALLSDPTFATFFRSIQEHCVDNIRSQHLLERLVPVYTGLLEQKKAVMDALGRADMAEITYNVAVAGAGENLNWYRDALSKHGCTMISSADSVEGQGGLANLLAIATKKDTPVSKKIDAVVVLSDIPLKKKKDDDQLFAGLDAVLDLSLVYRNSGIKFYVSSKCGLEVIQNAGIISQRRLKPIKDGHFFMTKKNGHPSEALASSLREELDRELSPATRIRSRHVEAFEAAEWLDNTYPERGINASTVISEFLMAAEEGVDTSRNLSDLRNVAHRIIEILKDCRAVPKIDNGAIPHLLYDGKYENQKDGKTYIQDVRIMGRPLASSLISMIDIGNEGTHTFKSSVNLGSAMLQSLLEFVTWLYQNKEEFSEPLTNYWHIDSEFERTWEETIGPAKLNLISGKQIWTCENVHLQVYPDMDIQEGDIVTVRDRMLDKGRIKIPGVTFFAYPQGYKNSNPNGYTIDKSGRKEE